MAEAAQPDRRAYPHPQRPLHPRPAPGRPAAGPGPAGGALPGGRHHQPDRDHRTTGGSIQAKGHDYAVERPAGRPARGPSSVRRRQLRDHLSVAQRLSPDPHAARRGPGRDDPSVGGRLFSVNHGHRRPGAGALRPQRAGAVPVRHRRRAPWPWCWWGPSSWAGSRPSGRARSPPPGLRCRRWHSTGKSRQVHLERGAELGRFNVEAPHLGAALQAHELARLICGDLGPATGHGRRGRLPRPDGLDPAHEDGPHQHHGHGPRQGLEAADHPFVAGEEPRYQGGGDPVDAVEAARQVGHRRQLPCQRHVDAVIVLGREVEGGEGAPVELAPGLWLAAEQLRQAEVLTLGLDQTARS